MVERNTIPTPMAIRERQIQEKEKRVRKKGGSLYFIQREKEELIRAVCSNQVKSKSLGSAAKGKEAEQFADEYARIYAYYKKTRVFDWRKASIEGTFSLVLCSRSVAQAGLLNATYEDYIKSQFYWFNDYFERAPRLAEMASAGAIIRYQKWKELNDKGSIVPDVVHPALAGTKVNTKDTSNLHVLKYETMVLERMIKVWGSEEDVWDICGELGDEEVFSDSFKMTRYVWKKMQDQ